MAKYNTIILILILLLLLICATQIPTNSATLLQNECKFPAIFNFGDSNSDTGGLSAAFGQVGPPAGETYFHSPAGRYSDGRLIIDFIAQSLGHPYLSAFLDAVGSNFSHGANFATAGSTVRPQNTTLHQSGFSPISLNVQNYQFNDFRRRSQIFRRQGGIYKELLPKEEYFKEALYTFDIGQNDITAGLFLNMSTDQVREYIPDVLNQFTTVIKNIYNEGGRYFWIHNTGPVGCLPYVMDRLPIKASQVDKIGCASPFNELAQFFNTELNQTLVRLRSELRHATLTYVDVYSLKYELLSHATKYAESLGLPYLSAYLNSVGSNFSHGANFATAGSTVRPQNTTISQSGYSPISLDVQFAEFSEFRKSSQVVRNRGGVFEGLLPKEEYFANALYTFDIGQNDLTAGYKLNMSTDQVKAVVPDIVAQFAKVVRGVYEQGGRSFWIHNTGPVGCLAYMLDVYPLTTAQFDKFGCAIPFNEASQFYNAKLKDAVDELKKDLPLAAITYVDVYSLKYTLITHAEEFGFEEALVACCGHGGKYNFNNAMRCGSTKTLNGTEIVIAKSCKNPSIKIIWDGIHYTEAANKWLTSQILKNVIYL